MNTFFLYNKANCYHVILKTNIIHHAEEIDIASDTATLTEAAIGKKMST